MSDYEERLRQRVSGLSPLQKAMLTLDVALTGHTPTEVVRQYHHYPDSLEKWIEREPSFQFIWYLSDGGYSRVVWHEETGNLTLTSNSRDQVKAMWDAALPERQAVQTELQRQWDETNTRLEAYALAEQLLQEAPEIKTLKAKRRSLSPAERQAAGEAPIQKSVVNGKTWYWSTTHRCYQARPTMKAAVNVYWKVVEPSG